MTPNRPRPLHSSRERGRATGCLSGRGRSSPKQLTAARRWQTYGLRAFGVGCLLAAMTAIASNQNALFQQHEVKSLGEYSALGTGYFHAIMGVELALVMLAAPAAVAGAICLDRSRGTLEHMLVTDLSDRDARFAGADHRDLQPLTRPDTRARIAPEGDAEESRRIAPERLLSRRSSALHRRAVTPLPLSIIPPRSRPGTSCTSRRSAAARWPERARAT